MRSTQPSLTLNTDLAGTLDTDWLVFGRRYSINLMELTEGRSLMGCFVWNGQEEIDMARDLLTYDELFPR